jgi:hypothetical protein
LHRPSDSSESVLHFTVDSFYKFPKEKQTHCLRVCTLRKIASNAGRNLGLSICA